MRPLTLAERRTGSCAPNRMRPLQQRCPRHLMHPIEKQEKPGVKYEGVALCVALEA